MNITGDQIKAASAAGVKLILTTKGIDEAVVKYFVEAGGIALLRASEHDVNCTAKGSGQQYQHLWQI